MCIIIHKRAHVSKPTELVLKNCLAAHSDGFGVMWRVENSIMIVKGTYQLPEIKKVVDLVPKDAEAVFHFRMATHGSVTPENCHPFPITHRTDALRMTVGVFDTGLAHNGIVYNFGERTKDVPCSDTMNFVKYIAVKTNGRITFESLKKCIRDNYGKFLILTPNWTLTFGTFVEEFGLLYSNTTFRNYTYTGCGVGIRPVPEDTINYYYDHFTGLWKERGTNKIWNPAIDKTDRRTDVFGKSKDKWNEQEKKIKEYEDMIEDGFRCWG